MVDVRWAHRITWEDAVENHLFLSYLDIRPMHVVGTVSTNSGGAIWVMNEKEVGPNLVVVVYWNLPDIIDMGTTDSAANWSDEQEAAEEFLEPL